MGLLAGEVGVEGPEIDQQQMVVGAPGDQPEAAAGQGFGQGLGVAHDPVGVVAEFVGGRLGEGLGLGRHRVVQRPALNAGEGRLVDGGGQLGPAHDAAPPGASQRLVGGEGDHVGGRRRVGVGAASYEAGDVGGVEHQPGPDLVGDLPQRLGADQAGVGGGPGHDQLGPVAAGQVPELVEVDALVAGGHAVGDEVVEGAGEVDRRPVGEVAPVVEAHAQHRVARFEEGLVGDHVGDGPGVGLHVGVVGPEQLAGPAPGQVLHLVHHHVAAVVAAAGVALAVLVGEHRAGGGHDGRAGEVLRGDELDGGVLAALLPADQVRHGVVGGRPRHQESSRRSRASITAGPPVGRAVR